MRLFRQQEHRDKFYEQIPPGGLYIADSGEIMGPEPIRVGDEELPAQMESRRAIFQEIISRSTAPPDSSDA